MGNFFKKNKFQYIIFGFFILVILTLNFISLNENSFRINNDKIKKDFILKEVKLDRVVDGDTLIIFLNGKRERLRLVGVNTPEAKNINGRVVECFGGEASYFVESILSNKSSFYFEENEYDNRDKYGRILGYFYYRDGSGDLINLNQKIIEDGYGYEYTYRGQKYKYQSNFKLAEERARKYKLGLWKDGICY